MFVSLFSEYGGMLFFFINIRVNHADVGAVANEKRV
jgi:hypothetical protein